jgi:2-polyprenyl-3-methyl-5-hydroxy-6-metoxy-1,4-benzoquinol methylase
MPNSISYARVKDDVDAANTYSQRKQNKHDQEMAMIEQGFGLTQGVKSALDAPCGVGRASIWMARNGISVTGIDMGNAALNLAGELAEKAGVAPTFEKQDIFALPYADRSFDASFCFRLLHHFECAELQSRLISELCRVADKYVLISRITPLSYTSLRRRLVNRLFGKPVKQYPTTKSALDTLLSTQGFERIGDVGRMALFHSLQLHVYRRK